MCVLDVCVRSEHEGMHTDPYFSMNRLCVFVFVSVYFHLSVLMIFSYLKAVLLLLKMTNYMWLKQK